VRNVKGEDRMKKEILIIFLLLITIALSGCLSSEEQKFIGEWKYYSDSPYVTNFCTYSYFNFREDWMSKKVDVETLFDVLEYTWEIKNNKLWIGIEVEGQKISEKFEYEFIDSNTLKLSKGTIYGIFKKI